MALTPLKISLHNQSFLQQEVPQIAMKTHGYLPRGVCHRRTNLIAVLANLLCWTVSNIHRRVS